MNRKVIITCALTGAGDTVGKSQYVPVTPQQIAESGIAAARAGAAIVHVHVRDRAPAPGSRDVALTARSSSGSGQADVDVVINTTAGMGGDLFLTRTIRPASPRAPTWSTASSGSRTSRSCGPTSARWTAAA